MIIYIYSFICSFTYTHSYTYSHMHSCILIHTLIHIFIHVYSFMYTHSYTHSHIHSCILIHVYSFITSFTYTHSRILLSFVIIFWLYVIIIIYHLTTLCVHDIFPLMFTIMFQFVSFSFSIIIFMFHEHTFTVFIFYIFLVSCLLHMALHILVKYDVYEITPHSYILLLYESSLLRNWNQPNRIIQTKVMAFSCQTSRFTRITLETVSNTNFSGVLTLYLTQSLCTHLNIRC